MSIPAFHKAAVLPKPGTAHQITDRATPQPGDEEVLIKITATAINPVDWKVRDIGFFHDKWPAVLGSDAAGRVVAVGSSVKDQFKIGDRVFFQGIIGQYDSCTFQQYCKMPAALVAHTPSTITDEQAAGISLALVAAVTGLYDHTGQGLAPAPWAAGGDSIGKGKAAVVVGGSSSVGQYAIQLCRLSGFEKIVTNSSAAHFEILKSLGATAVLDRSSATAADFRDAVGDLAVDFVYDAIAVKETQALGVEILKAVSKKGGNVIVVQGTDAEAKKMGEEAGIAVKQIVGLGSNPALRYLTEPVFKALGGEDGWIAQRKFVPNRSEVIAGGLAGLEEALRRSKEGVSGFKVVIKPQEA